VDGVAASTPRAARSLRCRAGHRGRDDSLADLIEKNPCRGAAPPQTSTLIATAPLPPVGRVVDRDWDGDLGDLSEEEDNGFVMEGDED
jgi:hypothetical protein